MRQNPPSEKKSSPSAEPAGGDLARKESEGEAGGKGFLDRKLLEARTILVSGQVTPEMAMDIQAKVLILENENPKEAITVFINSPGGNADSGFAIFDILKFTECPVRTVVNGVCASAAVLIFLGADKKHRFSLPHSRFLLHQPAAGTQGDASDLAITAREILKMRERYNKIVADASGQTPEKVLADVNRDFWLNPEEAREYGLVGKVISTRKELK